MSMSKRKVKGKKLKQKGGKSEKRKKLLA